MLDVGGDVDVVVAGARVDEGALSVDGVVDGVAVVAASEPEMEGDALDAEHAPITRAPTTTTTTTRIGRTTSKLPATTPRALFGRGADGAAPHRRVGQIPAA